MIPISLFLIIWFILLGIYGLLALISIMQMVRFSIGGFVSLASTLVFVCGAMLILFLTSSYLVTVDWSATLNISQFLSGSPLAL